MIPERAARQIAEQVSVSGERGVLERFAARLLRVERRVSQIETWHQATVTDASDPASITVEIGRGPVPNVATDVDGYRTAPPQVGDEVWVVELGQGRWLCAGRFG